MIIDPLQSEDPARKAARHANLRKLVDFLEFHHPKLRMEVYAEKEHEAVLGTPQNPCNSPACLVGFGPSAGIPLIAEEIRSHNVILWFDYAQRVFVGNSPAFSFLFACGWPNSIAEGVARIELFLADKIPDKWTLDDRYLNSKDLCL